MRNSVFPFLLKSEKSRVVSISQRSLMYILSAEEILRVGGCARFCPFSFFSFYAPKNFFQAPVAKFSLFFCFNCTAKIQNKKAFCKEKFKLSGELKCVNKFSTIFVANVAMLQRPICIFHICPFRVACTLYYILYYNI